MERLIPVIIQSIANRRNALLHSNQRIDVNILQRIIELMANDSIPKCQNYYEQVIPAQAPSTFRSHFRITPGAFEKILNELEHCAEFQKKDPNLFGGRDQINVEKALLITIWTLATPESYRSVGDRFNVAKSSVFICLHKIVEVILANLCKTFIRWPNVLEKMQSAQMFNSYGLPNVIGAIDGCHIPIQKPQQHGNDYYNRNKYFSVVLQAVCNKRLMFIDCDCRWPGSVHDARVLRTSDIYPLAPELCAPNYYIVGDKAYPCKSWLIPPFRNNGHLLEQQVYFNIALSKTRVVIENAFALYKGRFRRLKTLLEMKHQQNIVNTIIAACVLHNICILQGDDDEIDQYIAEGREERNRIPMVVNGNLNYDDDEGLAVRNHLVHLLWNNR